MSLINQPSPLTPAQQFLMQFQQAFTMSFNFSKQHVANRFNSIWNNSDQKNLSPDKAWAALGTNAVFVRHSLITAAQMINVWVPNSISVTEPNGWQVTENNDGTITAMQS